MGSLECSGAQGGGEPQQIPALPFSYLVTSEADGAGLGQQGACRTSVLTSGQHCQPEITPVLPRELCSVRQQQGTAIKVNYGPVEKGNNFRNSSLFKIHPENSKN